MKSFVFFVMLCLLAANSAYANNSTETHPFDIIMMIFVGVVFIFFIFYVYVLCSVVYGKPKETTKDEDE